MKKWTGAHFKPWGGGVSARCRTPQDPRAGGGEEGERTTSAGRNRDSPRPSMNVRRQGGLRSGGVVEGARRRN
jgi:hypothetical protein